MMALASLRADPGESTHGRQMTDRFSNFRLARQRGGISVQIRDQQSISAEVVTAAKSNAPEKLRRNRCW